MHTIADDQDQGGLVHGPVPVGQEGFAGARMGDLRRNSGRRELENSHGDVFQFGLEGSTRARHSLRGSTLFQTEQKDIPMAILKFSASAVAAQIARARACKTFLPNWNGPVDRPALILIVGNGVHLRSNGIDGTTTRIVTTEQADPSFAFADGMNPFRDTDWMAQRRMAFRDLTGQFYTDILDDLQVLIDRGQGAIRLATDGHSIRVFVRRASDYLIGGTYEVPSGLGGTFRVILKDACDTFAIVQNCGNCEDFDAMQPYRVPLDALMELDDRRVA